jgi:hypothetical protein
MYIQNEDINNWCANITTEQMRFYAFCYDKYGTTEPFAVVARSVGDTWNGHDVGTLAGTWDFYSQWAIGESSVPAWQLPKGTAYLDPKRLRPAQWYLAADRAFKLRWSGLKDVL